MHSLRLTPNGSSPATRYTRLVPRIIGRLRLLALATMLPLLCVGAISEYHTYREQRTQIAGQLLTLSRSMAATVGMELQTRIAALQVLAQSPSLQSGDLATFRGEFERFLSLQPPGANGGLVDADGTVQMLVGIADAKPSSFSRRVAAYATEEVVRTGRPAVSGFYIGSHSHRPSFSVDVPVRIDGSVRYDLSLNPGLGVLGQILANQQLPQSWTASVTDATGLVLGRSRDAETAIGRMATGPVLDHLRAGEQEAAFDSLTIEGTPVLAALTRVGPSGWAVGVAVPLSVIAEPLWTRALLTLAATAAALLIALLLARAIARTISGPILALNQFARAPEAGEAAGFRPTGLWETDAVAAALQAEATRRRAAEADLRLLNQELETRVSDAIAAREAAQIRAAQAERMQALGQLSGGIAHDFNNVLQAVVGALSIVERRATDEATVRRFAQLGLETAKRGSAITGRLLAFARHSVLQAEPWAPAPLLEALREVLVPTLGASIRIEVEAATDLPRLLADKAQLETALINLASNARDAMPGGGVLTLSAAIEVVTAADTHPAGLAPGRYVRLSVADTGTGIDAAVLRRVTEPFFTTKEQGKGTGLGLSVVKGFAEQSNGGFAISSTVGHGSVAHLFLPEASASTMPPSPAERMPRVAGRRSGQGLHRILLVEDQGPVREVVATELSGHGYEVVQAPDGNSALRMLDAGEVVDLLISDLSMPGMDGIALIAAVQQRRPMLRTILLTGYAEDSASLALGKFTGGSVSLVRKPVTGTQLADHAAVLLEPMMEV